ncbi:unnamed protein product [Notodromas monacha]|uniref:C2H2-type domain-containing protein n=1 Tax=Notodromas monacha TaxID=399045 RepID=A0A7R9BQH3_9CRUS|nr:unnamed protein product [Notodromas monacha]CAG0919579.1 unnamed protein product [Notodromas monacha]
MMIHLTMPTVVSAEQHNVPIRGMKVDKATQVDVDLENMSKILSSVRSSETIEIIPFQMESLGGATAIVTSNGTLRLLQSPNGAIAAVGPNSGYVTLAAAPGTMSATQFIATAAAPVQGHEEITAVGHHHLTPAQIEISASQEPEHEAGEAQRVVKMEKKSSSSHARPYGCDECSRSFRFVENLQKHIQQGHSEETKPHKCDTCGKRFPHQWNLNRHIQSHTGERPHIFGGSLGLMFFRRGIQWPDVFSLDHGGSSGGTIQYEQLQPADPGPVHVVTTTMPNAPIMHTQHVTVLQQTPAESLTPPPAPQPPAKQEAPQQQQQDSKPVITPTASYVCNECGKSFTNPNNLSRHKKNHNAFRPYACHVCDKRFFQRPYVCPQCNKAFNQSTHLYKHINIHQKLPHACRRCGERFRYKTERERHKKAVHANRDDMKPNVVGMHHVEGDEDDHGGDHLRHHNLSSLTPSLVVSRRQDDDEDRDRGGDDAVGAAVITTTTTTTTNSAGVKMEAPSNYDAQHAIEMKYDSKGAITSATVDASALRVVHDGKLDTGELQFQDQFMDGKLGDSDGSGEQADMQFQQRYLSHDFISS